MKAFNLAGLFMLLCIPAQGICESIPITITAYSPTVSQCDADPLVTASMTKVREGIVALSRDLERKHNLKFGDKVIVNCGVNSWVLEFQDRMHHRWKNKVDIFMWNRMDALKFGKQQGTLWIRR